MAGKKNHDENLERITNYLAESVLALSDEAIVAEVSEAGLDPDEQAEHTRMVLGKASRTLDNLNSRLSNLGHTISSNCWRSGHGKYTNRCLNCGSMVAFTTATSEMRGKALWAPCPESQCSITRQQASNK
jgi:hypothetical protein